MEDWMLNETKPAATTLVTFLLDRTGSMESIKDDTIGAFNAYLADPAEERRRNRVLASSSSIRSASTRSASTGRSPRSRR